MLRLYAEALSILQFCMALPGKALADSVLGGPVLKTSGGGVWPVGTKEMTLMISEYPSEPFFPLLEEQHKFRAK